MPAYRNTDYGRRKIREHERRRVARTRPYKAPTPASDPLYTMLKSADGETEIVETAKAKATGKDLSNAVTLTPAQQSEIDGRGLRNEMERSRAQLREPEREQEARIALERQQRMETPEGREAERMAEEKKKEQERERLQEKLAYKTRFDRLMAQKKEQLREQREKKLAGNNEADGSSDSDDAARVAFWCKIAAMDATGG